MENGKTMNAVYYAQLISQVRSKLKELRRGKLGRQILFLQDNAPVHTGRIAKAAVKAAGFDEVNQPPYSPDLAPSDYYLFRDLKSALRGKRYDSEEDMKAAVEEHFTGLDKTYFLKGLKLL